jgi:hypothetical protein
MNESYTEQEIMERAKIQLHKRGLTKGNWTPNRDKVEMHQLAVMQNAIHEAYKAGFEDGVLKTQERIKQRIECEKIEPIQKKYDTWASGLEDGVLELEWLFAWMADNKAKYLKPKK